MTMDSLGTNPQLTAEFVKFLNAQLQDCRDQLQRLNEENVSLRQTLESTVQPGSASDPTDDQAVSGLNAEITSLKDEVAALQCTAEVHRKDAVVWRERYEKAKTSVTTENLGDLQRRAAVEKVMKVMKEDLVPKNTAGLDAALSTSEKFVEFSAFMSKLSGSAVADTHATESRVVFDKPKLQILPKAAIAASDGGFAFFGGLLQWCDPPSQNALLICPTRHYTPHSGPAESMSSHTSWSTATQWASLASQRREIFDTDGDQLIYAGTFLVHAGPKVLRLQDLPQPVNEALLRELASRTFDPASKSQKTKARAYLHALAELYSEGAISVQVLGLQRVGFNEKFFGVLRRAYGRRSKGRARSETQRSVSPFDAHLFDEFAGEETASSALRKRAREEEAEVEAEVEAGPSKVRRVDDLLNDGWF